MHHDRIQIPDPAICRNRREGSTGAARRGVSSWPRTAESLVLQDELTHIGSIEFRPFGSAPRFSLQVQQPYFYIQNIDFPKRSW
jgi:hypothetical protein